MTLDEMLGLPEVAYLVQRIPIAKCVLTPSSIHLWFCRHARDTNMPLKEQCRVLDIPWHARKVGAEFASPSALAAARMTEPTLFAATFPSHAAKAAFWCSAIVETSGCPQSVRHWLAYHATELADDWERCKGWIMGQQEIAKGTSVKTVLRRAAGHVQEIERARHQRAGQLLQPASFADLTRNALAGIDDAYNPYLNAAATQMLFRQREAEMQAQNNAFQNNYQNEFDAGRDLGRPLRIRLPNDFAASPLRDVSPIAYPNELAVALEFGELVVTLLSTHEQFVEEGENMHNCVGSYWPRAKAGLSHIVRVRTKAGKKVATAEFSEAWQLVQVKGPANADVRSNHKLMTALAEYAVLLGQCEASLGRGANSGLKRTGCREQREAPASSVASPACSG